MITERKLTKVQIFDDDVFFFLKLTPISTWPFLRFVEKQIGMKAYTGSVGDYEATRDSRFIAGDVDYWNQLIYPKLDRNPLMSTILQNPVDFVLEMYWNAACDLPLDDIGQLSAGSENPQFSIQDFLRDPNCSHLIDNYQSTQLFKLCDAWSPDIAVRITDNARRLLVRERVEQMAFFGLIEHYQLSQDLFMFTFDRPFSDKSNEIEPIKMKISSPEFRRELLKPDIIAEIRQRNRTDEQTYYWAKQYFLNRYQTMTRRLESELRWKESAFGGIQVVALDPAEQFSHLELRLIKAFRRLRAKLLPQGSRRESWVLRKYMRARGHKPLQYPLESDYTLSKETYHRWLQANKDQAARVEKDSSECMFSLLLFMTRDNTIDELSATIQSCNASRWKGYELVIVYPGDHADLQHKIEARQAGDERIKLYPLPVETNGNRKGFGTLIQQLQGQYLFLIRPGDRIHRDLLCCVHNALAERSPGRPVDILYFDEDHLDEKGGRMDPWFKPATFSPEMLISVNYLRHAVYHRKLFSSDWVQSIPLPPSPADEWSLAFHCVEQALGEIIHIPRVLYHRRNQDTINSGDDPAENCEIIERHLQRKKLRDVSVNYSDEEGYRANWDVDDGDKVSIIIPTKNKYPVIKRCVDAILALTEFPNYEIVLVDTGSSSPRVRHLYSDLVKKSNISITNLHCKFNYSRANNFGAMQASGSLLLFLNNDTEPLVRGWLSELVRWAKLPGIGAVGAKLLYPDGAIQAFGTVIGMLGHAHHVFSGMPENCESIYGSTMWYRNATALTGACMLMRRDVFQKVGGFNSEYEIVFSDVEICLKIIEAGYRILCTPYARLTHFEGKSRYRRTPYRDIKKGLDRFGGFIQKGDRYYNNNLSLQSTSPALRSSAEEDALVLISRVIHHMQSTKDKEM